MKLFKFFICLFKGHNYNKVFKTHKVCLRCGNEIGIPKYEGPPPPIAEK
jgi:hypothetical protein